MSFRSYDHSQVPEITVEEAAQLVAEHKAVFLDVRESLEFAREYITGASFAPLSTFNPAALPFKKDEAVLIYCRSGKRSLDAAASMLDAGYTAVWSVEGGIEAWKERGFPVKSPTS
jgi:rhodanese-related sulfurtransferase